MKDLIIVLGGCLALGACERSKRSDHVEPATPTTAPSTPAEEPPKPLSGPLADAPPPKGVILPAVGRAKSAKVFPEGAATTWEAIWVVPENDSAIAKHRASNPDFAEVNDARVAGELYGRQVEKSGKTIATGAMGEFRYPIADGEYTVFVGHTHPATDWRKPAQEFKISVGLSGG